MKDGGRPEYVLSGDIAYHKIKDEQMVKDFFKLLMEHSGKQLSLNQMANILGIGVDTARRFQSYFEETYLIYTVEKHSKLNERLRHPKKIYAGDVGIRNLITGYRDKGAIFENLVYLKLKQRNPRYVYEQSNEIDFITDDKMLIEVKYHSVLNDNKQKLFETYPAKERIVVDCAKAFIVL